MYSEEKTSVESDDQEHGVVETQTTLDVEDNHKSNLYINVKNETAMAKQPPQSKEITLHLDASKTLTSPRTGLRPIGGYNSNDSSGQPSLRPSADRKKIAQR